MKRHDTNHLQGAGLRLLGEFARSRGLSLSDESTQDQLLSELKETLSHTRKNPIRLHGFRVQAMFSYLAAALGNCKIITEEDSGIFFDAVGSLTRPDFRVITRDGLQFLVEVKNHHQKNAPQPYRFKEDYLQTVTQYAELMGLPLKFAIYWSRWKTWTLTDAARLPRDGASLKLPFADALRMNEMGILGEVSVGTLPPLALRLDADTTKSRQVNDAGEVGFTIGKAALYSGGIEITQPDEMRLAWMLMLHGEWAGYKKTAIVENQHLEAIEFSVTPEIRSNDQEFEIIGSMSQIISNQYLEATSAGKEIKSLAPTKDSSEFGAVIPRDYDGKAVSAPRSIR